MLKRSELRTKTTMRVVPRPRTALPLDLVQVVEDYAALLADDGYAQLAPLLLAACDAEHQRMGTGRDQWQERETSDARAASQLPSPLRSGTTPTHAGEA
jgi:hypothetical protein